MPANVSFYVIFWNRNCNISIPFRMAARQSRLVRKKHRFYFNWLPWQRPLKHQKKKIGLIICNSVPIIWCNDCEILRLQVNKIRCHGNVPWDIEKKLDLSSTLKTLSYTIQLQKSHVVCVLLMTQNWLPWQRPLKNQKNWTWSRKRMQKPSIWRKDRVNRSSRYWRSLAQVKKNKEKKEINASKICNPSGKFAERAN